MASEIKSVDATNKAKAEAAAAAAAVAAAKKAKAAAKLAAIIEAASVARDDIRSGKIPNEDKMCSTWVDVLMWNVGHWIITGILALRLPTSYKHHELVFFIIVSVFWGLLTIFCWGFTIIQIPNTIAFIKATWLIRKAAAEEWKARQPMYSYPFSTEA